MGDVPKSFCCRRVGRTPGNRFSRCPFENTEQREHRPGTFRNGLHDGEEHKQHLTIKAKFKNGDRTVRLELTISGYLKPLEFGRMFKGTEFEEPLDCSGSILTL